MHFFFFCLQINTCERWWWWWDHPVGKPFCSRVLGADQSWWDGYIETLWENQLNGKLSWSQNNVTASQTVHKTLIRQRLKSQKSVVCQLLVFSQQQPFFLHWIKTSFLTTTNISFVKLVIKTTNLRKLQRKTNTQVCCGHNESYP